MSQLPYMPLWIEPLLADTNHLTNAEFGCYVRLLCAMWRLGGSIPDDEVLLRRLVGQGDRRSWPAMRKMLEQFVTHEGGRITQKRLKKVRLMQDAKRLHTRHAAQVRWHGHAKSLKHNDADDADADANGHAEDMLRALAQEPKPNKKEGEPPPIDQAGRLALPTPTAGSLRSGPDDRLMERTNERFKPDKPPPEPGRRPT